MNFFLKKQNYFILLFIVPFYHFSALGHIAGFDKIKFLFRLLLFVIVMKDLYKLQFISIRRNSSFVFYVLYLLLAFISLFYSSDSLYSFIKYMDMLLISLVAIWFFELYAKNIENAFILINKILIFYVIVFFVIGSTIYPFLYRTMGVDGSSRLGGYLISPNLLGYTLVIILILNIFFFLKDMRVYTLNYSLNRFIIFLIFISGLILLLETVSRSALGTALVTIPLAFYYFSRKKIIKIFVVFFILLSLLFALLNLTAIIDYYSRGHMDAILTLTGRIPIWNELIENYKVDFYTFLGFGFQMLSDEGLGTHLKVFNDAYLTMAHNNFLQVFFGLGVVGVIIVSMIFIQFIRDMYKLKKSTGFPIIPVYILMLILIIFSMVEFGVFGPNNILIYVFVTLLYTVSKARSNSKDYVW